MPKLTAASVEKCRPAKDRREIPDAGSPGLYLIVQASGRKSWALRFRKPGGRSAKLTLGPVDLSGKEAADEPVIGAPLTLASARRLAAEVHRQRAMGKDVTAQRHRERLEREARGAATFDQAAIDFITKHGIRKTRRWQPQARLLGLRPKAEQSDASEIELELIPKGLADRWRDRPIIEIDDDEIHRIVEDVIEKGIPGAERRSKGPTEPLARSMHAALSKMFGWLVERKRLKVNPVANVHSPKAPKSRDRVLSDSEIAKLWMAAGTVGKRHEAIIKLLLLTGCRREEVIAMRRSELSGDGKTWVIPGQRTKNHLTHIVPLPPLARDILAGIEPVGDFMFSTTGRTPVAGFSKLKRRLDAKMQVPPWRFHDLRRTCATGMAEIGIMPHVVEACLNHISGAKAGVAGTYNRATYAAEKKAALERWASHVEGLVTGRKAKVVRMRGSAS